MSLLQSDEYDLAGMISRSEVDELRAFTKNLRAKVLDWLRRNHPGLLPDS